MLLATNLNFNLTTLNYFPVCSYLLKSLKPVSSSRFPISKFVSKEAFLEGNYFLGSKNMVEVVRTFAIRNTRDDEGVRVFEEEELIDGSSQFPSGFVTNDLQSTINRLVANFSLLVPRFSIMCFLNLKGCCLVICLSFEISMKV